MWSSVLDAYVDDEEEGSILKPSAAAASTAAATARTGTTAGATDGEAGSAADRAAPAAGHTACVSRFASPPRKKRIDLLRLQMCCPTIVGAAVDSATAGSSGREQRPSAHSLFAFPLPRGAPERGVAGPGRSSRAAQTMLSSDRSSSACTSCSAGANTSRSTGTVSSVGWQVKAEKEDGTCVSSPGRTAGSSCRTNARADADTVSGRTDDFRTEKFAAADHAGNDTAAGGAPAAATDGAQGAGEQTVFAAESAAAVGPDGIPLLKYERGVFHVAEEAPVKAFRVKREQMQAQQHTVATGGVATPTSDNGIQPRGKKLLSMLPKPQHEQPQQLFPPVLHRLQQRAPRSSGSNSGQTGFTATDADRSRVANSAGVEAGSSSPTDRSSCVSGSTSSRVGGSSRAAGHEGAQATAEAEGEERGPLFSLFSAYDDETEEAPADVPVKEHEKRERKGTTPARERECPVPVKAERADTEAGDTAAAEPAMKAERLPLLGISFDVKDQAAPSDNKGSNRASCPFGGALEQLMSESGVTEESSAAGAVVSGDGEPVTEPYVDVWGEGDAAGAGYPAAGAYSAWNAAAVEQPPREACEQRRVEGMSLNEYRELQNARVKVVSGESLRDPDWQLNYQLHATPAHVKRTKLNISTNVWSVKDKGIVQTVEPRAMQKRKHQINWLAAEAAEKELEMWEMMAKTRQNKHNTSMKYGW